ncbi:MAG TPA: hypothetical protein VK432_08495 [Stellaceae bacterium]|nr:hypothetical protein [Stellaceae bacterium]
MKHLKMTASAFALAVATAAPAALADDLKGYSIEATIVRHDTFRTDDPRSRDLTIHKRIYIGMAGHVFDYSDLSAGPFAEHGGQVTQADRAASLSRDRMKAWEIQGDRLTGILHVVEGFYVTTFQVDPSRTSCTIALSTQPDPSTGRLVETRLNGRTAEVVSSSLSSYTCVVKKGNVFASDQ